MVFSSLLFLFRFLPAVLLAYYIVPCQWRNCILLIFSLAFYAWGEPVYFVLMAVSILVSYIGGILIERFRKKGKLKAARVSLITSWIGIISYAFQIYFDFSAYSDMAIGLGHMFGFRFSENFNYPYLSKSITEFWRRSLIGRALITAFSTVPLMMGLKMAVILHERMIKLYGQNFG